MANNNVVETALSDMFFDACFTTSEVSYTQKELMSKARALIDRLDELGVNEYYLCHPAVLVNNFYERMDQ